jgi:hypothetical protein
VRKTSELSRIGIVPDAGYRTVVVGAFGSIRVYGRRKDGGAVWRRVRARRSNV